MASKPRKDEEDEEDELPCPLALPRLGKTEGTWEAPRTRRAELRELLPLCRAAPSALALALFGFGPVFA